MLLINHAVCTFQPYHHAPHAFGFSGLLLCGWRLCYVLAPPNTKFTGKTNHSYTTTKQLEKRFWLCQKFRGQLFVPAEPVVRRKGEKSINALAPLLLGAVAIFRMFVSTFYNGTILVTFRSERHTCGISGNYKFNFIFNFILKFALTIRRLVN